MVVCVRPAWEVENVGWWLEEGGNTIVRRYNVWWERLETQACVTDIAEMVGIRDGRQER